MELILGTAGQPHVTSQQMREIFKMVVGSGSYILNSGEYIEPELQSNQALRIRSGILMHHGGIAEVKQNTYDEVTIGNGTQGMKRIDLVVARYTKDPETEHETMTWVVIQGTPAASDPAAPDYTEGDMQNGDLTDDCPVFEVHLDGIQVTEVVKLVEILDCDLSSLNGNIQNATKYIPRQSTKVVSGSGTNVLYPYTITDVRGMFEDESLGVADVTVVCHNADFDVARYNVDSVAWQGNSLVVFLSGNLPSGTSIRINFAFIRSLSNQ